MTVCLWLCMCLPCSHELKSPWCQQGSGLHPSLQSDLRPPLLRHWAAPSHPHGSPRLAAKRHQWRVGWGWERSLHVARITLRTVDMFNLQNELDLNHIEMKTLASTSCTTAFCLNSIYSKLVSREVKVWQGKSRGGGAMSYRPWLTCKKLLWSWGSVVT